jgi:phosphonate transport system substrate-binding protein
MKPLLRIFLLSSCTFIIACSLMSCDTEITDKYTPQYSATSTLVEDDTFIFGIHPLHNPARLHEFFGPITDYLSNNIEGVSFKIEASRNYATFDEKLYSGKFHFALPNPYQTINSFEHGYKVFAKMADDENFRGIIIVRKDSGVNEVTDLKGGSVSFPAPTALAATMLPQYFLQAHGLDVMQDIDIQYVGSQESSIMNVMLGNTIAGATWPPPWRTLSKERPQLAKEMKIIWRTPSLPNNSLVARKDIDQQIVNKVKALLLTLHEQPQGKAWLAKIGLSQFETAENETYDPVFEFIARFNKEVRVTD